MEKEKGKKRKTTQSLSLSLEQENPTQKNVEIWTKLEFMQEQFETSLRGFKEELLSNNVKIETLESKDVQTQKKLGRIHKQYVKDRGLSLANELLLFISQIHGIGFQRKSDKIFSSLKFDKLIGNVNFELNCLTFSSAQSEQLSYTNICTIFTKVCNSRNGFVHYNDPEECLHDILKFQRKHGEKLHKCIPEVQYCIDRIVDIGQHFSGPYRLKRLACQFISRFLASQGCSWTTLQEFDNILTKNKFVIAKFKPQGMKINDFKAQILNMFWCSAADGPQWTGKSADDSIDCEEIKTTFKTCQKLNLFPGSSSSTLEHFILMSAIL